jgi:hypothetical protein
MYYSCVCLLLCVILSEQLYKKLVCQQDSCLVCVCVVCVWLKRGCYIRFCQGSVWVLWGVCGWWQCLCETTTAPRVFVRL